MGQETKGDIIIFYSNLAVNLFHHPPIDVNKLFFLSLNLGIKLNFLSNNPGIKLFFFFLLILQSNYFFSINHANKQITISLNHANNLIFLSIKQFFLSINLAIDLISQSVSSIRLLKHLLYSPHSSIAALYLCLFILYLWVISLLFSVSLFIYNSSRAEKPELLFFYCIMCFECSLSLFVCLSISVFFSFVFL